MPETWVGVAVAALALLGTAINTLFTRLNTRDRLEFDGRFQTLQAKQESCEEKHEICEKKHEEVIKKLDERETIFHQTEARLWALENHLQQPPKSGTRITGKSGPKTKLPPMPPPEDEDDQHAE